MVTGAYLFDPREHQLSLSVAEPTSAGFAPGQRLTSHHLFVYEYPSASRSYVRLTGRPPYE